MESQRLLQQQYQPGRGGGGNYDTPAVAPPEPLLQLRTTANLRAATANGGEDPDDFYRSYNTQSSMAASTSDLPVATLRSPPSSLRSNGNGTTPKHPPLAGVRQNLRSVSAPYASDRPNLNNARSTPALGGTVGKVNVKDMLKRFDQNNDQASTTRKPVPKIVTQASGTGGPGYMKDRAGYQTVRPTGNTQTTSIARAGAITREVGSGRVKSAASSRTTQRARFAAEDQQSNNTLSTAARTNRPRNAVSGNYSQASKSMTNLSPTSAQPASQIPARRPLFGEIIPNGLPSSNAGHQLPHTATRRTSDSSLHPSWSHLRSRSDQDTSPSSPTAWYLGGADLEDVDPNKLRASPGHNRNHSDFADAWVNTMSGVSPAFHQPLSPPTRTASAQPSFEPSKSSIRVPLIRKPPSDTSSQASTRSNSPFASKAVPLLSGKRKPEHPPWNSTGIATAPANRTLSPTVRTTTPSNSSVRSKTRSPEIATKNKSSLKAYISAPPEKNSPPLRSSRPRQPVSSATTASARHKPADETGSPQKVRSGMKLTRSSTMDEHKPRRIADGPVDFAERRLTIQRAYTNRIQENEQKEIRAANLRRLQERQARNAAEKAKAQEEAEKDSASVPEAPTRPSPGKPLHISTSFSRPGRAVELVGDTPTTGMDSPTLGMPGTFVDVDDTPASAISNVTGVTDIDNEPQTEAAHRRLASRPLSSQFIEWDQLSPEQASYRLGNSAESPNAADGTINMMLDTSPSEGVPQEPTPTNDLFNGLPSSPGILSLPGAFKRDSDYGKPVFTTTVTTASPEKAFPSHSRAVTPHQNGVKSDYSQMPGGYVQEFDTSQIHPPSEIPVNHEQLHLQAVQGPSQSASLAAPLGLNGVHDYLNTPVTDIDYDSSDGYGGPSASEAGSFEPSSREHRETQGTFQPNYRRSHQSAWTDYSLDTTDDSSEQGEYPHQLAMNDLQKPSRTPPAPDEYSIQPPPHLSDTPRVLQLPLISTGEGFGMAFSDRSPRLTGSVPLWPEYSPPPVPDTTQASDDTSQAQQIRSHAPPPPSLYNCRPPSSIYQSSQNGTSRNTESRRASDAVYSPRPSTSTPRSSTQISLEEVIPSQSSSEVKDEFETEADKKAAEKTKKRLKQRQMVIKELIDTESVYLKDMNVVEEIYKGTAEACPKLDTNDIRAIFRNSHEIVAFSTMFLEELKIAGSSVYSPRNARSRQSRAVTSSVTSPTTGDRCSIAPTLAEESDEQKDLKTFIGANFGKHLKKMQTVFTDFLKNQEVASERLAALQADPAVKVWLTECNMVAKDLTAAWDLDALLVKPVQRITRYQLLLQQMLECTPNGHPDHRSLQITCAELLTMIVGINELKGRLKMVGAIVGRKRKESDVRSGIAKAFGRRSDKPQLNVNRPHDDELYVKLHEKYGDDFLRLQVVLRDVEFYTRQCATYVNDFLRYLSAIELVMRLSPSPYPELESKWARFNMSMRDMGTVALDRHVAAVKNCVIIPIEQVIQTYGPPGLAMKKRNKRRLDFEKSVALKAQGKKGNKELSDLVSQYEALNETLKMELPKLSQMTVKIGKICQSQFVSLQVEWYKIWQDKVKVVLETSQLASDIPGIMDMFQRDFKYQETKAASLGIVNGTFLALETKIRSSQSTTNDAASSRSNGRPSNISSRSRGLSITSDQSPSLPTPDFAKRHSGQFSFSPITATAPANPQFVFQQQPYTNGHSRNGSGSPAMPDLLSGSGARQQITTNMTRPSTGRSFTSDNGHGMQHRLSTDYNPQHRRESSSTYGSGHHVDGPLQSQLLQSSRPYSGLFHSAMPLPDGPEESQRSSRASSRDRNMSHGYNVLYLAASLFEFNISATKQEAGYPYLTYQAGEIFDVIGEKGELWLAKNQDDPADNIEVGWIWSKHFARLATD